MQNPHDNFIFCFDKFRNKAKNLHTQSANKVDGRTFWQQYKADLRLLDTLNLPIEWNINPKNTPFIKIKKIVESQNVPEHKFGWSLNGEPHIMMHEANHFLIQLIRIPLVAPCTIRKIMQIALNLGQLEPNIEKTTLRPQYQAILEDFISHSSKELFNLFTHVSEKHDLNIPGLYSIIHKQEK